MVSQTLPVMFLVVFSLKREHLEQARRRLSTHSLNCNGAKARKLGVTPLRTRPSTISWDMICRTPRIPTDVCSSDCGLPMQSTVQSPHYFRRRAWKRANSKTATSRNLGTSGKEAWGQRFASLLGWNRRTTGSSAGPASRMIKPRLVSSPSCRNLIGSPRTSANSSGWSLRQPRN
jgi:hypothetical protein